MAESVKIYCVCLTGLLCSCDSSQELTLRHKLECKVVCEVGQSSVTPAGLSAKIRYQLVMKQKVASIHEQEAALFWLRQ
ncbi:hypothetical protein RRG08_043744 [Elysia crispata]|uniref:Uncharacterized protein n=1 Tax=Elysia crispata TaxID=231223 RepID=A0AAE1DJ08_9GAST|nr:hypothetical protein RRG08_043744 [Elysia crispata]